MLQKVWKSANPFHVLPAISTYDTLEAFCHGVLLNLMAFNQDYMVSSNRESGLGRFDVESKQRYDLEDVMSWK